MSETNKPTKQKTGCGNCHGMGQLENGSRGPIDCPPCKGNGWVYVVKEVTHYEPVRTVNINEGPDDE